MELKDLYKGNFYHVCTDGNDSQTLMKEDEDDVVAVNYIAISSWRTSVQLAAYCVMSNHFHFLVMSDDRKNVDSFITLFKRLYAMYFQNKYGQRKVMKDVRNGISLIYDVRYLQNCIAYILRNPLSARICGRVEDYPWSSYRCYFSASGYSRRCRKVSDLSSRQLRTMLKTDKCLDTCPFLIDESGNVVSESFVRTDVVEKLFRRSGKSLLFSLGVCNDAQMEYELTVKPMIGNSDHDIVAEADKLAARYFPGKKLSELGASDKCRMIKSIFYNNKTTIPQLSRVLGLPRDVIRKILCT